MAKGPLPVLTLLQRASVAGEEEMSGCTELLLPLNTGKDTAIADYLVKILKSSSERLIYPLQSRKTLRANHRSC